MARARSSLNLTPDILVRAYSIGLFPMAEKADDDRLFWVDPEARGIFPLDGITVSTSLAKIVRADRFYVVVDRDFEAVIDGCAGGAPDRPSTWINRRIRELFGELFARGDVHTVEAYRGGDLVGGLYGLHIGGAFFGESMFHRATDASKVCLVHLAARLVAARFALLDAQFVTPHLASLGAIEIPRSAYRLRLDQAVALDRRFASPEVPAQLDGRAALSLVRCRAEG